MGGVDAGLKVGDGADAVDGRGRGCGAGETGGNESGNETGADEARTDAHEHRLQGVLSVILTVAQNTITLAQFASSSGAPAASGSRRGVRLPFDFRR